MKVEIPFEERWRTGMLSGKKIYTTRTKKYGKPGDTFEAFGALFELKSILRPYLGSVAKAYFKGEGCGKPIEFVEIWRQLHPRKGFDPLQIVYLHIFERVERSSQNV